MPFQRILLIQLRQLGDILLTTPAIRTVKEQNPNSEITFLCHDMGRKILDGNPYIDHLLCYRESMTLTQNLALLKTLRQKKFDLCLDFMNNPRSALFALASGAPKRLAKKSARSFCYTEALKPKAVPNRYIVDEKWDYLTQVGFAAGSPKLDFFGTKEGQGCRERYFQENPALAQASLKVVLAPCHRREPRKWPASSYVALAEILVRDFNAQVSWIWGGPEEGEEVRNLQKRCNVATHVIPNTNFKELAAILAAHDIFIGNSNGPSHLAVAVGMKTLQLHGPTRGTSWSPCTAQHQILQGEEGDIATIPLAAVIEKTRAMLPTSEQV